jgi:Fe-S oxidoreductase
VEAALLERDLTSGEAIWFCLSCDACTDGCPCGVAIRDFIGAVREICLAEGRDEHVVRCRGCDEPFMPGTTLAAVLERTVEAGAETPELLLHCPRCRAREHAARLRSTFAPTS